jgi:hypothetical protein
LNLFLPRDGPAALAANAQFYVSLIFHNADSHRIFIDGSLVTRCTGRKRDCVMLDIVMLAIGLGFFALSIGYAYVCDQL